MRRIVAKRLYLMASQSPDFKPTEHKTKWYKLLLNKFSGDGKQAIDYRGTIFCTGFRRIYQDLKKQYKVA